ncbi:hypothetical protein EYF80_003373 [Liparis tanakae]|uniref:Uncharacterized protein n=1 Tax=Liparis tanakae TaxID=230148 RepID=A0A4Z2J9C8_9TELE|nr:hypothetical protein EYF80_003373 [Liparis tanakae]
MWVYQAMGMMTMTPERKINRPPRPATNQLGLSLQQRTPGMATASPIRVTMREATIKPWAGLMTSLSKYVVSCRLQSDLWLVEVALQISQMPCWMNSDAGMPGISLRVLQFGATVAVRFRIQPHGARTNPKMRMPGVRKDNRIHSCGWGLLCCENGDASSLLSAAAAAKLPAVVPAPRRLSRRHPAWLSAGSHRRCHHAHPRRPDGRPV